MSILDKKWNICDFSFQFSYFFSITQSFFTYLKQFREFKIHVEFIYKKIYDIKIENAKISEIKQLYFGII